MRRAAAVIALLLLAMAAGCKAPAAQTPPAPTAASAAAKASTTADPFPAATSVRLYVNSKGRDPVPTGGVVLTPEQRREFEATLHAVTPPPPQDQALAACFIPHHFFRYYDAKGGQIGEVAVCFCCGGVQLSDGTDRTFSTDYDRLERLVKSLGLPTDVNCND